MCRGLKKNGRMLQVVKIDFAEQKDKQNLLTLGFSHEFHFCPASDFVMLKLPVRCFKYQRYEHRANTCRSKPNKKLSF